MEIPTIETQYNIGDTVYYPMYDKMVKIEDIQISVYVMEHITKKKKVRKLKKKLEVFYGLEGFDLRVTAGQLKPF